MNSHKLLFIVVAFILMIAAQSFAADGSRVTDIALHELNDREVISITVDGKLPSLDDFELTIDGKSMRFYVPDILSPESPPDLTFRNLVRNLSYSDATDGFRLDITLESERLVKSGGYRIGELDGRIMTFEFFKEGFTLDNCPALTLSMVKIDAYGNGYEPGEGELRQMDVKNLSYAAAENLFGKLFMSGTLPLNGELRIYSPNHPNIKASNAASGLPELLRETPPDFVVFAGTRDKLASIADELNVSPDQISEYPKLGDVLHGRDTTHIPESTDTKQPHERGYNDYPEFNEADRDRLELIEYQSSQSGQLSDVRVSLDASLGLDFYAVMSILSEVSGISIIVDPYTFQEPVGGSRPPLQTSPPTPGQNNDGGFRDAGEFNPDVAGGGGPSPFFGSFIDAPFDTVFNAIISANNLAYLVLPNETDPYAKPTIFVTSRERMEHELRMSGANNVSLIQAHYADVNQLGDILLNMDVVPSLDSGYYVYTGGRVGGGYSGSGGNGGNGQGSGGSGSGRGGIGGTGTFGSSIPLPTAKGGLIILRGSGADQAGFYNRLVSRESKNKDGRLFFLRVALTPDAIENMLPASELNSYFFII